jgi:hypothetical protein
MKKAIVLGAAMLLAGVAAFAADVKFSGKFRTGYTFDFSDSKVKGATYYDGSHSTNWKGNGGRLNFHVTDADGAWDLNYKNIAGDLDSNDKEKITATVNFDKLLDLNGLKVSLQIGNKTDDTLLRAYGDVSDDHHARVKAIGDWVAAVQVGYDAFTFRAAVDPVYQKTKTSGASDAENLAGLAVSGKYSLADYGVNVAAGYAHNGQIEAANGSNGVGKTLFANVFSAEANADIAKMIGTSDFKLGAGVAFNYGKGDDTTDIMRSGDFTTDPKTSFVSQKDDQMVLAAQLTGGVDAIDGWVEYVYSKTEDKDAINYLKAQANINVLAQKGVGLDVYGSIGNFDKADETWVIGGDVSYKLKTVEFGLNPEVYSYQNKDSDNKVGFSITPKMTIAW